MVYGRCGPDGRRGSSRRQERRPPRCSFEHAGASACRRAAAAIVDAGATFGGAGKTSNGTTAKMNLESWRKKPVFEGGGDLCRGDLTISMAADGGEGHPVISEEGRLFLARTASSAHGGSCPRDIRGCACGQNPQAGVARADGRDRRRVGRGLPGQGPADRGASLPPRVVSHWFRLCRRPGRTSASTAHAGTMIRACMPVARL